MTQDVMVGMRGRVSGFFTMTGDGTGRATYDACFVAGNCVDWEWEDENGWAFSGNYYLALPAGDCGHDTDRTAHTEDWVRLQYEYTWPILWRSKRIPGPAKSPCALHIRSSHDIAWTSESGVFFSEGLSQGDNNFDGDVDGSDLAEFIDDFGRDDCAGDCDADFDFDGNVDNFDLASFAVDFGTLQ